MSDLSRTEKSFGQTLCELMEKAGLTQIELAKRAKTTQPVISSICNRRRQCGLRLALKLATALDLIGKDRTDFLTKAKMPQWKGFDHGLYGTEAIIFDVVSKSIQAAGIDLREVRSVTPIDSGPHAKGSAVIVMADGSVFQVSVAIRRQESPSDAAPAQGSAS